MTDLIVRINRRMKTATFSGPGTFAAKEAIKSLGQARWVQEHRSWEVRQFLLSNDELSLKFTNLKIEEEDGIAGATAVLMETSVETDVSFQPSTVAAEAMVFERDGRKSLSVAQLSGAVRRVIKEAFPGTVLVYGVLSSVKQLRDDRVFMELADPERPDEIIRCVIWRDAEKICKPLLAAGFRLEADLQVMFEAQVDLSRKWASISLNVVSVVAEYTLAKLAARRDQTNERLKKEGIFSKNKSAQLAFLPIRLGLLTSAGGTVLHDFRAALDQSQFGFELLWYNVNVQGAEAKSQLIRGLQVLAEVPGLDAILIFRGGGSPADLAVFNEYELARAVCLCPLPVISAIGHQEDQSSVQDVSFLALGVPKDIGHYFARCVEDRRRQVDDLVRMVRDTVSGTLQSLQERLGHFAGHLHALGANVERHREDTLGRLTRQFPLLLQSCLRQTLERLRNTTGPTAALIERTISAFDERLHLRTVTLDQLAWSRVERVEQQLTALQSLVEGSSPEVQLKRGFSLVRRGGTEEFIRSGADLEAEALVDIQFHDMVREAKIR